MSERDAQAIETGVAWAASVTGGVSAVRRLTGGLTSTMLGLTTVGGDQLVLRLMTNEPWRAHGPALTRRERDAQTVLASTDVPAPRSIGLDAQGAAAGVSAHLMTALPGESVLAPGAAHVAAMAEMLAVIHDVEPERPFRTFESWAWDAKWVVPAWTRHPRSWEQAFDVLAGPAPQYAPSFLHRDFSHRNLLWEGRRITGVVDWVETSTGPAWLDAAHAATNLAIAVGPEAGEAFLSAYAALSRERADPYWLVMDAVGFLPAPGRAPLFGAPDQLARLDEWLDRIVPRQP